MKLKSNLFFETFVKEVKLGYDRTCLTSERGRARLHAVIFNAMPTYENWHYCKCRQYLFQVSRAEVFLGCFSLS
jgi:hypothetical protein